ncbi:hypothetical protein AX16_006328 [Volvariella volvacea WC 439]|nr:hypothetical protein AX16_009000 [Volvariella volvacea WC 439]KAF8648189.1 hypothetical protein AX16_006328 [Volvariella volvacea WC 439]
MLGPLLIAFLARTLAYPVSSPDSPIPSSFAVSNAGTDAAGCIRDPTKIRTLWELVYNCFGTIAVCTYIAIHPNMPDRDASAGSKIERKLKTTLHAVLFPELVIMWAMRQRLVASRIAKEYREYGWTKTHGFFVQMGGLIYYDGKEYRVVTIDGDGEIGLAGKKEEWMQDIMMPLIPEEEIQDKAKGDFLSKLVVVIQTSWFILQCIARHMQGLVVTELEIITLAYAALNIITYTLWWNKPLNATYPIYFTKNGERCLGPLRKDQLQEKRWLSERYWGVAIGWPWEWGKGELEDGIWQRIVADLKKRPFITTIWKRLIKDPFLTIWYSVCSLMENEDVDNTTSVGPYYAGWMGLTDFTMMNHASSVIGTLFGGLHLIGWDLEFLTDKERILWRVSSIILTAVPPLYGIRLVLHVKFDDPEDEGWVDKALVWVCHFSDVIAIVGGAGYVFARVGLCVLALLALRDLPPSAYQNVRWTEFIPHI